MCTGVLLGVLGGALIAKLALRRRFGHGGGCGGRGFGRHAWHRGRNWRGGEGAYEPPSIDLAALAGGLDLSSRQREDAGDVLARLDEAGVRGEQLRAVLAHAGADTFEPILVEEALGWRDLGAREKEILDGVEHLHHILTPEQRDKLRRITTGAARA
jgi:hypothetical protein